MYTSFVVVVFIACTKLESSSLFQREVSRFSGSEGFHEQVCHQISPSASGLPSSSKEGSGKNPSLFFCPYGSLPAGGFVKFMVKTYEKQTKQASGN